MESLRSADSAASLARDFGRSRQFVSYHLKELERVGLVRHAGERRKGNFLEQLYESVARRCVVSARFGSDPGLLASVFRDQVALSQLADLGERLQEDAARLIDVAVTESLEIPSASVEAEVRFADEGARAAFMTELIETFKLLLAKHGAAAGPLFRVALAAYPEIEIKIETEMEEES